MTDAILISRDGGVATLVLNRPDKLNAMTKAMWIGIAEAMERFSADDSLRCVVLRGAGEKAFAAGADIAEFASERADKQQARAYGALIDEAMTAVTACRHPTIARLQGACVGGGLELAACCDLRLAAAGARFGVPVNRLGLTMGYGELKGLIALVGRSRALEIVLEGRIFGAEEARDMGLVTRVVPDADLDGELQAMVGRVVDGAPLVARWHKRFARRLADGAPLTQAEWDESYDCFDTEDFRIGQRAFVEKTKPRFEGR
jgi:enoyl-CoA hydratase/carnithine racemase